MSVYVGGCNKNVLLSISKNTGGCWEMLFPFSKVFTSTKSYWFWYKGFINNSLKFCPRNFKNNEIDCAIYQRKIHSELQKFKEGNVAAIWNQVICLKNWKLSRPPTTIGFNTFYQNFTHVFYLTMPTKGCLGYFLFCLDLELSMKIVSVIV